MSHCHKCWQCIKAIEVETNPRRLWVSSSIGDGQSPFAIRRIFGLLNKTIFVSATPAYRELEHSEGEVVEQIIRPTGLLDPTIEIRDLEGQVDDLFGEIKMRVARNQRVLVTTLTKKKSEHLANYYDELGLNVAYLHSDIPTIERVEIIRDLRQGKYDVLIGINLLREGLDMPEVSLVAILDADKEGFLRNRTSLIQTIGRAAETLMVTLFYTLRINALPTR